MSYILDALKKADSERQHGKTPDIHSQPVRSNTLDNDDQSWKKHALWLAVVILLIIVVSIIFLMNWQRVPQMATVQPTAPATAPAPMAPPQPAPVTVQNTPAPAATTEPAPANPPAPATAASAAPAPVAAQTPAEPVKEMPAPTVAKKITKEKRPAAASAKTAKPTSAVKKPADKPPVDPAIETISTTLRDLPLGIQNEIPTITVGGYIYSANKGESQLLINKMLLREGEQVVPGLVLERMMPHSAILNYKGYRYRIAY